MTIKSRIFERGHEHESDAISDYGTGERGRFKYCQAAKKVLPIAEAIRLDGESKERKLASVAHGFIQDEMPPTKHPIDGKYYTSQAKFREVTKAHGFEEVGTAYENGYSPEARAEREFKEYQREINREWKQRLMEK